MPAHLRRPRPSGPARRGPRRAQSCSRSGRSRRPSTLRRKATWAARRRRKSCRSAARRRACPARGTPCGPPARTRAPPRRRSWAPSSGGLVPRCRPNCKHKGGGGRRLRPAWPPGSTGSTPARPRPRARLPQPPRTLPFTGPPGRHLYLHAPLLGSRPIHKAHSGDHVGSCSSGWRHAQ